MNKKYTLTLISVLFTVVSCGIPTFKIIESPSAISGDTVTVGFSAPVDDSDINGYEIYYKIYDSSNTEEIQADIDSLDSDNSNYVQQFGNEKLLDLKFHRMLIGSLEMDDAADSLIIRSEDIAPGQQLEIIINPIGDEVHINNASVGIPLRNVKDDSLGFYLPFSSVNGESDANGVTTSVSEFSISFAAYSYPDILILEHESSLPVYLGTITRTNN